MKSLLGLLLKSQHLQNSSKLDRTEKGMTLIELLIGMVMAFLIITPMLAFVVDMLNTDRREQVKANTEQDIQSAVDFIAQELSQAIYIYDNRAINGPSGPNEQPVRPQLPTITNGIPILVFWKRQQIRNAVSVDTNPTTRVPPSGCNNETDPNRNCNDTYVRSLVVYYQVTGSAGIWCQPSGGNCPSRIVRYEIREGVRNPGSTNPAAPYYENSQTKNPSQQVHPNFNPNFDFNQPTQNVTQGSGFPSDEEVLVNYIDHNDLAQPPATRNTECQTALGNPTAPDPGTTGTVPIPETTLKIRDDTNNTPTNSFYACVDTQRNLARVTIRGNSLRRLQDSNVKASADNSAFFPTASVQVQGRGVLGQ
jgi:type II secretory pathway pseudopilin PulG